MFVQRKQLPQVLVLLFCLLAMHACMLDIYICVSIINIYIILSSCVAIDKKKQFFITLTETIKTKNKINLDN